MKKAASNLLTLATALLLFFSSACNQSGDSSSNHQADIANDTTGYGNEDTEAYSDDISRQLHGDVIGGEEGFAYSYTEDPFYDTEDSLRQENKSNSGESTQSSSQNNTNTNSNKKINRGKPLPKVKPGPVLYKVTETDRPPLFSADCIQSEDPASCSTKALTKWVNKHANYPPDAQSQNQEGVQYVTFIINQRGVISSITDVNSNGQPCDGCSRAAVNTVSKMPDWQPAMKDGKPVSVMVTLPIRFRIQDGM